MLAQAANEARDGMSITVTNNLYAHAGSETFIMRPETKIDLETVMLPTKTRRNLQSKWWARLVAKPEAHLHHHIEPGRLVMFGASDVPECLIAPGLSLNYLVFAAQCGVSLHLNDGRAEDQRGEAAVPSDWERAIYQRLLAHRDEIEASFGAALRWSDTVLVGFDLEGGYLYPDRKWDEIIDRQVGAMNRLHAAFTPHLSEFPELSAHG
jgi:hypothetical protein